MNINFSTSTTVSYEVRDLTGKLVTYYNEGQLPAGSNAISLNTENWAAGTHTVRLIMNGKDFATRPLEVVR